jgi:hypothetical protein
MAEPGLGDVPEKEASGSRHASLVTLVKEQPLDSVGSDDATRPSVRASEAPNAADEQEVARRREMDVLIQGTVRRMREEAGRAAAEREPKRLQELGFSLQDDIPQKP